MKRTLAAFSAVACALVLFGACASPPAEGRRSDTTCDRNGGGDAVGDPTNPCNLNRGQ